MIIGVIPLSECLDGELLLCCLLTAIDTFDLIFLCTNRFSDSSNIKALPQTEFADCTALIVRGNPWNRFKNDKLC